MLVADDELLGLYVHNDDPVALEQLIRRHSKMVMGVCRSLLWQQADAEDAFQAVFLLLSKKAPKLLKHNSLGGWLHESAVRISLKHRGRIIRKREVAMSEEPIGKASEPWQTIAKSRDKELLNLEISRLPKRYRDVIVLCYLEGKSRAQAASVLDITTSSVKASLARGRNLLRRRLMKQGIAASIVLSAVSATASIAAGSSAKSVSESDLVSESLIQSALAHCQGTLLELGAGVDSVGTSADIVRSLIAKEISLMNLGLAKSSLAIAASIVAVCSLSIAAVGSQIFTDETQVIVSPVAVESISAVSATVVQEDSKSGDSIGSEPVDAPSTGITDESPADSDQAPPDRNKLLNNVALIKPMMQIRPSLRSDAVFSEYQPAEFKRLRARQLGPDSKGYELIDSRTQKMVRKFLDTNNDGKLDTWIFFNDGVESHRDFDLDFNGKVDLCRYIDGDQLLHGFDENEDGQIDSIF